MNTIWKKDYALRAGDFDKFDCIKPSAVLDLFQDAAGQHAEELGVGFEDMIRRSYLWVLTRIRFCVVTPPKRYQRVIVKTWPLEPERLIYRREYRIETEQGDVLIAGSSEWIVMHSEKRRPAAVSDLYPFRDGFCTDRTFDEKLKKIADFDADHGPYIVNAGFSNLDVNNHVNNTRYADFVLDAVSPGRNERLREFQIDYRKEVLESTQLDLYHTVQDGTVLTKGQNTDGDVMFVCRLEYEDEHL